MGKSIIELSDGNPGAAVFLMTLMQDTTNFVDSITILAAIENANIVGTDLWVLYSDLGGKHIGAVAEICNKVPMAVLKDACSRQDRSGSKLIEPYMSK